MPVGSVSGTDVLGFNFQNKQIGHGAAKTKPISGGMDRASATETVDLSFIPGQVKPKSIKIGIDSFPAWRSAINETVWSLYL